MDNKIIVNAEGLQQVSNELAKNAERIYSLYTSDIASTLESCQEELKISGLDYSEVSETFKAMFNTLNTKLEELITALNTTIIPGYEISAEAINKMFNNDFASQINEYLSIMRRD